MAPLTSTGSVVAASTASMRRCGPVIMTLGWIGDHLRHSHAAREIPVTRGRTSTSGRAMIEGEVKLPGDDLHHFQILRHMHVPGGQIESPFPRTNIRQIDLRPHIRSSAGDESHAPVRALESAPR
jgi:hypothetical protein